jgi:restriction endonuclease S subunit
VLSKNNNMINMIDATKMYTSNKKLNIIDEEQIYNAYINNENKISDLTIKDKNYSFIASNYLYDVSKTMSNPIKLKDYVEIYRGYRGLKENENDDKVKIIQISNLNSSFIDNNELDIISYDSNMKKDLLQNNDIIFSRITRNFQCHLVHIEDNEKVIASENIIILRVKDNKFLSPHYLKEYLNSENGKNSVFANQVKSVSTMIQINGLSETYINLLPMDKQLEIEKLSISKYEELINNKKKIASINSSIINLLDN